MALRFEAHPTLFWHLLAELRGEASRKISGSVVPVVPLLLQGYLSQPSTLTLRIMFLYLGFNDKMLACKPDCMASLK